jgi:hypothetical protein
LIFGKSGQNPILPFKLRKLSLNKRFEKASFQGKYIFTADPPFRAITGLKYSTSWITLPASTF